MSGNNSMPRSPRSPDPAPESVEALRERLTQMKRLIAERQNASEIFDGASSKKRNASSGIINGSFLSFAFGGALLVIVSVSIYAFYSLFIAVLKKFPSRHTEL